MLLPHSARPLVYTCSWACWASPQAEARIPCGICVAVQLSCWWLQAGSIGREGGCEGAFPALPSTAARTEQCSAWHALIASAWGGGSQPHALALARLRVAFHGPRWAHHWFFSCVHACIIVPRTHSCLYINRRRLLLGPAAARWRSMRPGSGRGPFRCSCNTSNQFAHLHAAAVAYSCLLRRKRAIGALRGQQRYLFIYIVQLRYSIARPAACMAEQPCAARPCKAPQLLHFTRTLRRTLRASPH